MTLFTALTLSSPKLVCGQRRFTHLSMLGYDYVFDCPAGAYAEVTSLDESPAQAPAGSAPPASAPAPSSVPASQKDDGLAELAAILRRSATARGSVIRALRGQAAGSLTSSESGAAVAEAASTRGSAIDALPAAVTASPALVTLLRRALSESVAADQAYAEWLREPRTSAGTAALERAHAADTRATAAKVAFGSVYNPLARRAGLRVWTQAQW